MSIPVIINPAARSSTAMRMLNVVKALKPEPELHFTQHPGHATELAEQMALEGRELVVAAGGDGTVNEVLQGLCKVNATRPDPATHTALGTLPAGTMNVFAYEIGFPSHKDLINPWRVITSGESREIDLWQANDHYFMQLAGVGIDAEIVRQTTTEMKQRFGPLSYGLSALKVLFSPNPVLTVSSPGRVDLHGCQVVIGNGRNYGGRFTLFPNAKQTDGLLDVVVLRGDANVRHILQILRGALLDSYAHAEDVDYVQLPEFTVTASSPTAVELDGEHCGESPLVVRKAPFSLRVAALADQ